LGVDVSTLWKNQGRLEKVGWSMDVKTLYEPIRTALGVFWQWRSSSEYVRANRHTEITKAEIDKTPIKCQFSFFNSQLKRSPSNLCSYGSLT